MELKKENSSGIEKATWRPTRQGLQSALYLSVFLLLAEALRPGQTLPMAAILALILLVPRYRLTILAVGNLVCGLMGMTLLVPARVIRVLQTPLFSDARIDVAIFYLVSLAFFYFYAVWTIKWPRARATGVLFAIVLAFSFLDGWAPTQFAVLTLCLIGGIFYNAFYLRTRSTRNQLGPIGFLANQQSYLLPFLVPMPGLLGDRLLEAKKGNELLRLQEKGIGIALLSLAMTIFLNHSPETLIHFFAPSVQVAPYHFINPSTLSPGEAFPNALQLPVEFEFIKNLPLPLVKRWLATFLFLATWMMLQISLFGVAIGACYMIGVETVLPVYDLFGAKSLYQFFERYNPYYCRVLLEFFVYPLHRSMTFIKNPTFRLRAAFAVGIVAFGLFCHHLLLAFFDRLDPWANYPLRYLHTLIYWVLMAAVTSLSIGLERKSAALAWKRRTPLPKLKVLLYFVITAVLFLFIVDYYMSSVTLSERFRFFLSLFGL